MTDIYDKEFRDKAIEISKRRGYGDFTKCGVYCMVSGPNYESPADLRFIKVVCRYLHVMSSLLQLTLKVLRCSMMGWGGGGGGGGGGGY